MSSMTSYHGNLYGNIPSRVVAKVQKLCNFFFFFFISNILVFIFFELALRENRYLKVQKGKNVKKNCHKILSVNLIHHDIFSSQMCFDWNKLDGSSLISLQKKTTNFTFTTKNGHILENCPFDTIRSSDPHKTTLPKAKYALHSTEIFLLYFPLPNSSWEININGRNCRLIQQSLVRSLTHSNFTNNYMIF